MPLSMQDFIVYTIETKSGLKHIDDWTDAVEKNLRLTLRQIGDSTTKRMRRNVSASMPYGTTADTIVRRRGRVYDTIGFRVLKDPDGLFLQMGAVKGTQFGRQLAVVHDQGAVITAKRGWVHDGVFHKYLIYPPPGSPARDPSTGEQIMTANETAKKFYSQWDTKAEIMIKRTKDSDPEVAFIKATRVKIPARRIISREYGHVVSELERKVPTSIKTGLRLQTLRF